MADDPRPNFVVAVASRERREVLEAVRDNLADRLGGADPCDDKSAASIARQLLDVTAELATLPTSEEVDPVDAVASAGSDRRAKSKGRDRS